MKNLKLVIFHIFSYLLILFAFYGLTIWIGYPLFLGDSYGYISRAIEGKQSLHWSNLYSLFIQFSGINSGNLVYTSLVQNLLLLFVLAQITKQFFSKKSYGVAILSYLLLIPSTLPWISNMVMSDIFTSIGLFCMFFIIVQQKINLISIINYLLFCFSFMMHKSHLLIYPLTLIILSFIILTRFKNLTKNIKIVNITSLILCIIISQLFFSKVLNKLIVVNNDQKVKTEFANYKPINSGYYFVINKLNHEGGLSFLLDEFCKKEQFEICNYKRKLKKNGTEKVTLKQTPLRKMIPSNKAYFIQAKEVKKIVLISFKNPKYWKYYIFGIYKGGIKLLKNNELRTGFGLHFKHQILKRSFGEQLKKINQYKNATDSKLYKSVHQIKSLSMFQNKVSKIYAIISLLVFVFFFKRKKTELFITFTIFIVSIFLINCFVCGGLSNPNNSRYFSRISWVLYLPSIILLANVLNLWLKSRENTSVKME